MSSLDQLRVKIFADGADMASIVEMAKKPHIKGFTTNPTLMRQAGVTDYQSYAIELAAKVPNHPISFEVFADEFDEMEAQARVIKTWGPNVNVKIPIQNSKRESALPLIEKLSKEGVALNITAIMTAEQVKALAPVLSKESSTFVSVFAGRVADTGVDPLPIIEESRDLLADNDKAELLWASTREVFNIFEADRSGCDIITVGHSVLNKLGGLGTDLDDLSLEAVQIFLKDSTAAGFSIAT